MIGTKKEFITIDIGYGGIKAAKLNFAKKNISLSSFIHEPYPPSDIDNINIDYQENKVKEFIKKHQIQGHVVFTLSDPSLTIQSFHLPMMPYDEIPEAVKWEISRNLKLDPNEILYDFLLCNNSPDAEKEGIYIMAAICSREPYERIAKAMRKRKLKLLACDIPIICDYRVMEKLGCFDPEKTYIIMNFGSLFTNLSVIYKKEIIFNRRISLNGLLLTRAVKDYCKVDADHAESFKSGFGLSADVLSDNIIESVNIVNSNCEKMVSDIQYSLKYFSYQVSRSNITTFDKVYITGGASQLKGFQEFVKERLNIEIVSFNLEDRINVIKQATPDYTNTGTWGPYATTVVGGLFWTRKGLNKKCLNVLPGELTEGGKKEFISYKTVFKRLFSVFGAFLVLFAFFMGLILTQSHQKRNLRDLKKLLEMENARKEQVEINNQHLMNIKAAKVKENEELEAQIEILTRKLSDLKNYELSDINPAYLIGEVINMAPYPQIALNVVSFEKDKIIIRGDAVNNNVISDFMRNLNDSKYFFNSTFDFMEKTTQGSSLYSINFKLTTRVSRKVRHED